MSVNIKKLFATMAVFAVTVGCKGYEIFSAEEFLENKTLTNKALGEIDSFIEYKEKESDMFNPDTFSAKEFARYVKADGNKYVTFNNKHNSGGLNQERKIWGDNFSHTIKAVAEDSKNKGEFETVSTFKEKVEKANSSKTYQYVPGK